MIAWQIVWKTQTELWILHNVKETRKCDLPLRILMVNDGLFLVNRAKDRLMINSYLYRWWTNFAWNKKNKRHFVDPALLNVDSAAVIIKNRELQIVWWCVNNLFGPFQNFRPGFSCTIECWHSELRFGKRAIVLHFSETSMPDPLSKTVQRT